MRFDLRTGEIKVEAEGFIGPSCQKATEFLKNTLGEVTDFTQKSEWFEENLQLSGCIDTDLCG